MRTVTLFVVPEMPVNEQALEAIEALPEIQLEIVTCPSSMHDWYVFPFVKDEENCGYYGLSGVEFFVSQVQHDGPGSRSLGLTEGTDTQGNSVAAH